MAFVHAIAKVTIELKAIYLQSSKLKKWGFVKQSLLLSSQIIFRMLKKANAFWMILKH
jgi:hypothetical protein